MKKFQCSAGISSSTTKYNVVVIADSEYQAREMASGWIQQSDEFSKTVQPQNWSVAVLEDGFSGDTKVVKGWQS
jgi:hypothetical protein